MVFLDSTAVHYSRQRYNHNILGIVRLFRLSVSPHGISLRIRLPREVIIVPCLVRPVLTQPRLLRCFMQVLTRASEMLWLDIFRTCAILRLPIPVGNLEMVWRINKASLVISYNSKWYKAAPMGSWLLTLSLLDSSSFRIGFSTGLIIWSGKSDKRTSSFLNVQMNFIVDPNVKTQFLRI